MPQRKDPGLERLEARVQSVRDARIAVVRVVTQATTGRVMRAVKKGPSQKGGTKKRQWVSVNRSAATNIIAIRDNANKGRNLLALRQADRSKGSDLWQEGANRVLSLEARDFRGAAEAVGNFLVQRFRAYLDDGMAARRFKKVMPGTAKAKQRETGEDNLPPMKRTGQLGRALKFEIEVR